MERRTGVMVYLGHDTEMVRQMARIEGVSASAWVARAARRAVREQRRRRGIDNDPTLRGKGSY